MNRQYLTAKFQAVYNGISSIRQRVVALFFVAMFLSSCMLPSASALAAEHQNRQEQKPDKAGQSVADKHTRELNKNDLHKPMKQDYAEGMTSTKAEQKAAVDSPIYNKGDGLLSTSAPALEPLQAPTKAPEIIAKELTGRRTADTATFVNEDGSITTKQYFAPKHFKKEGAWKTINTKLVEDKNAGDSGNVFGRAYGNAISWFSEETSFIVQENDWHTRFAGSDFEDGMLRVKKGNEQVGFSPIGANDVNPVIKDNKNGDQTVYYYDLWDGIDVSYVVRSSEVKESIIIKNKDAVNKVSFKVLGASLVEQKLSDKSLPAYALKGSLEGEFAISPANLILNEFGFVTDESVFRQSYGNGKISLSVDKEYLRTLPAKAFPAVIDPSVVGTIGTRAGGTYMSFKSDGYICYSNVCNPYAGTLYDSNGNLQAWRGAIFAPYDQFRDSSKILTNARLHLTQRSNESFWTGDWGVHNYQVGHATCLNSYHCVDGVWSDASFGGSGDINVTQLYQSRIAAQDFGAWIMIMGHDGTTHSYKNFDPNPDTTYVEFTYGGTPAPPTMSAPTANQVYIDPQASFKVNPTTNTNGNTPLQYEIMVSTGPAASGLVMRSGRLSSTQWTIPDGTLNDGSTYYVQALSYDPITNLSSAWGTSVPFRIDTRTGKHKTQTYDTLGPVNVDLATGNVSTGVSSHTSAALGGSLGVGLDYNSPLRSRNGLVGEYWNVASGYSGDVPTSAATVTRVDQNIDFGWDVGSPAANVGQDWFYTRWTGYFVAPKTGTYYFGGRFDDALAIYINNVNINLVASSSGNCHTTVCYGDSVTLQAGQVVPFRAHYQEATSSAYAHVWVKGAVNEQIVSQDWLRTGVRPVGNDYGLTGQYFAKQDGTNTFSTGNPKVMQRIDPVISFDWQENSPIANGPSDFLVRWSGYITVPTTGTYEFGGISDDGTKITIGSSDTIVYNDWNVHGSTEGYGTGYTMVANQPTRITIEYFDSAGAAHFFFKYRMQGSTATQLVPGSWLRPASQVLPAGWDLGLDADGSVTYDHIRINQNSVILTDSTGATHEYTWTGSGYKPPVNEDGNLVRNADGTFTMQDTDGRTYVFAADGSLVSVTSPVDDRAPAALKYEYEGTPSRLKQITDGVDTNRWAKLYYGGANECGTAPSNFESPTAHTMLCALITNDGRATYFYYLDGQLARITEPGDKLTDLQYESVMNPSNDIIGYRLISVRDSLANDAIAAGVRNNDASTKTELTYDILGRVQSVKQPAPNAGATRMEHTIEYLPGKESYVDSNGQAINGYYGATQQHVAGLSEVHGFTRRIEYDNLYRTTKETDVANQSITASWHPLKDVPYSTTDAIGLMSTTIYDDDDRPTHQYGPAPTAWYDAQNVPLSAYASQVPHSETKYDENIVGPAVAWYNYAKPAGNTLGTLSGAPKLHTTGIQTSTPGTLSYDFASPPVTASSGAQGIGLSATGKLRLPVGTYNIKADTSDGVRVWLDDVLVVDSWADSAYRTVISGDISVTTTTPKRLRIDTYRKTGSTGTLQLSIQQHGGFSYTTNWSSYLTPGYNLSTSSKAYDSTAGNNVVATSYGANPELGLPQTTTVDPAGLNLSTGNAYEAQGASGSFLRQTSKTLPGGNTFTYSHYDATETRDNPCTTQTESYRQAGFMKAKAEPDPDGSGSQTARTSEVVYDSAGRVVATRYNNENWICITYDSRGRVTQTVIPAYNGESGRTVSYSYTTWGNPLAVSVSDSQGTITTTVDLLGRTIEYIDFAWNSTTTTYDNLGRVSGRNGPLGNESYVYDNFHRLTEKKLDGTTYARVTYDEYGRTKRVDYPNAGGQRLEVGHDQLGRLNNRTYYTNTQPGAANLIANPSVEQAASSSSEPQAWHTNSWGTNAATFSYLNEGYTGGRSLRTKVTSYTSGDAKWHFDPVAVSGNTAYTFSDYYRSNTATQAVVQYTHQDSSLTYEWLGSLPANSNWTQASLSMTTPATATHATVYHMVSGVGQLDIDDAKLTQGGQPTGQGSAITSDTVVRSQSGRITSDTVNTDGSQLVYSYGYDAGGRLTGATIGVDTFTYGFGTQASSCGSANNSNSNAGKNSNRVSQTINGASTTFCYDYADRLVSSSNPSYSNAQYDSRGNMTALGTTSGSATETQFSYDSSGRLRQLTENTTGQSTKAVFYSHDATGRMKYRDHQVSWQSQSVHHFGYGSSGGSPDIVRDNSWAIVEKYLSLPGGVLVTIRPQQQSPQDKTYSLSNIHGDVFATTNTQGIRSGTHRSGPYGEALANQQAPANTVPGTTHSYLGQHQKLQEQTFLLSPTVLGARTYLPGLGRFTQVDPIEGGTLNSYIYAVDPVNFSDLSGACILQCTAKASYIQPAARITQVQPTAPARRVQGPGSARSNTGKAGGAPARAAAVSRPANNMPLAPERIDFAKLGRESNGLYQLMKNNESDGPALNWRQGGSSALDYYNGGRAVGAVGGCAVGAISMLAAAPVGCAVVGAAGMASMGPAFAFWGFVAGVMDLPEADYFEGWPDVTAGLEYAK